MKKTITVFGLLLFGALVFGQANLPEYDFVSGNWELTEDSLYQHDADASLAKVNINIPQEDAMIYEFQALYEGGAEDGHGGFGLHLFVDKPHAQESWGAGKSYLLWLNYDENPGNTEIPAGLSAQLYRSYSNSRMDLVQSFDLNDYAELLTEDNLTTPIPFKFIVDGNSGEIQVYDPVTNDGSYFVLNVEENLPLKGDWLVLRTNGMKMSFTY
jgi:hypothetical protein